MADFNDSWWSDPEFSREYLDNADAYVPFRQTMLSVILSFCEHFLRAAPEKKVLDLGCGDGFVGYALMMSDPLIQVTFVDGSPEMLRAARRNVGENVRAAFLEASFQDLITADASPGPSYHLAVSALAIHHLTSREKREIYEFLDAVLHPGGRLLHLDTVLAPSEDLEQWSMLLWQGWVNGRREAGLTDRDFSDIVRRYRENRDNKPDTLAFHLDALKGAGFRDADCLFRFGPFALWTGRKPE